ncbi:MAG: hypothetical protein WCR06_04450 [bacterium]
MHTLTQLLIGMAAAGVMAGPQRPAALVAGAVAGVLPDVIDWWAHHLLRQPDITVTPDPLAPTPATMVKGLHLTLQQAQIHRRPIVLRFNPLPAPDGGYVSYRLDCDRLHHLCVTLDMAGRPERNNLATMDGLAQGCCLPQHPLPLQIRDASVDLQFCATQRRIESLDLSRVAGVGHTFFMAGVLAGLACLVNIWFGLAVAAALAAHLLLDAGGRNQLVPGLPFSNRLYRGWRLWDEDGWRVNLYASVFAAVIIAGLGTCRT